MTEYNETLAYEVTGLVSQGYTLLEIERMEGMPPAATFAQWLVSTPPLALAYAKARETSSFTMEDEALALTRAAKDRSDLSSAQLKALDLHVNQLRWSATKRNPQVYSEKAAVSMVVPVQINTTLDMGGANTLGTPDHPNIYELKAVNTAALTDEAGVGAEVQETPPRPKRLTRAQRARRKLALPPPKLLLTPEERAEAERERELRRMKWEAQREKNKERMREAARIRKSRGRHTAPAEEPGVEVQGTETTQ